MGAPYPHVWWEQVAMNDNGEAVAAWADFDPTGKFNRIYANVLDVSSGVKWSGAVPIDQASPDAGLADQPQNVRWISVSLDRDGGAAQVTWMQHAGDANSTPQVWANWIGE